MKHHLVFRGLCLAALASSLILTGCNRSDDSGDGGAGKGGNATLRVTPRHHGLAIDSCTIYIKYNSSELSATFDDSVQCVQIDGKPVGTFSGLKKGNYYIYGKGWDPYIIQSVAGGIPYTITEEQAWDIAVPVTESDDH